MKKNNTKKNEEKTSFIKKFWNVLKRPFIRYFWIFCLLLSILYFLVKTPYFIAFAVFMLLIAFLTCPWFNKLMLKINIKLTKKQKWFIGLTDYTVMAYSITYKESHYYRSVISILIMLLFWFITIFYSRKKEVKNEKNK